MQPISRSLIAVLLVLSACSSPNPALYTIRPVPGVVQTGPRRVIVLREVGVARYLDRSQIVRSGEDYKLVVSSNDWWGEPLAGMITRVLVDELSQRLPDATVTSETSVVSTSPDATLEVDIHRLDGTGGNAWISRKVHRRHRPSVSRCRNLHPIRVALRRRRVRRLPRSRISLLLCCNGKCRFRT